MGRGALLLFLLLAAALCGPAARGGPNDRAANRLLSESDYAWLTKELPHAILVNVWVGTTRAEKGGESTTSLYFYFAGTLFPDAVSRFGSCSIPSSALDIITNSGPAGGTATLDLDFTAAGVNCDYLSAGTTRLALRFTPDHQSSGEDHGNWITYSGGARYHVQSREAYWRTIMTATVDGYDLGSFTPGRVVTYRATYVEKLQ